MPLSPELDLPDSTVRTTLGAAARRARKQLGLTQKDVAERLGISMEVYGRLERGVIAPSVLSLRRLCLVLQVSADTLLDTSLGAAAPDGESLGVPEVEQFVDVAREPKYVRRIVRRARDLAPSSLRLLSRLTLLLPTKDRGARWRAEMEAAREAAAKAEAALVAAALEDAGLVATQLDSGDLVASTLEDAELDDDSDLDDLAVEGNDFEEEDDDLVEVEKPPRKN
jgi:transcriptional regulator with XRE-family HTH domain